MKVSFRVGPGSGMDVVDGDTQQSRALDRPVLEFSGEQNGCTFPLLDDGSDQSANVGEPAEAPCGIAYSAG
jgi:hypothetical protein